MNEILVLGLSRSGDPIDAAALDAEASVSHDDNTEVKWVTLDSNGMSLSMQAQSGWPDQDTVQRAQKIIALVPGEDVLATQTQLPKKRSRQVLQALPFAIEEHLIDRPENVHVCVGATSINTNDVFSDTPVAVCRREKMERWLEQLKEHDIKAHEVRPEWDFDVDEAVISNDEEQTSWQCLLLNGRAILLDDANAQRLVCPADLTGDYLASIVDDEQAIEAKAFAKNTDDPVLKDWESSAKDVHWQEPERIAGDPWVYLARHVAAKEKPLNLLQGMFAHRREWLAHWQRWRAASILLAAFLLAWGLSGLLSHQQLKKQSASLQTEINRVYDTSFKDLGPSADPAATVRQWLAQQAGRSAPEDTVGVLRVLSALAVAGKDLPDVNTESLSYSQGQADLKLTAPDAQQLEKLQALLAERTEFSAEIRGFNNLEKGIEAQVRLGPKTADAGGSDMGESS